MFGILDTSTQLLFWILTTIAPESLSSISRQELLKATVTKGGSLIIRKIITGDKSGVSDYVYLVVSPALSKQLKSGTSPSLGSNYQVVEFFSGYPGLPQTWLKTINLASEIEKTELRGKIPPTLAIVPSINVVRGADTECLDIPGIASIDSTKPQMVK